MHRQCMLRKAHRARPNARPANARPANARAHLAVVHAHDALACVTQLAERPVAQIEVVHVITTPYGSV